jgi:adenine phosphoribosyltransferase
MNYDEYQNTIQTHACGRYDTSSLFHEYETLRSVTTDLAAPFSSDTIEYVAGIDALGFVLGTAVALELQAGFVPIRKGRKLPIPEDHLLEKTVVDYTDEEKTLELDRTAIAEGSRVLLVDDWIETAAQISASIALIEQAGGRIEGICVIGVDDSNPVEDIDGYMLQTLKPR